MESYGFNSDLSLGNQMNQRILSSNREIRRRNMEELKKHQDDVTQAKKTAGVINTNDNEQEVKTIGEGALGQVGSKGKDIEATYKTITSIPKAISDATPVVEKYLLGGVSALVDGATGNLQTAKDLFKSDAQLISEGNADLEVGMREAERVRKVASGTTSAGQDLASFLKAGVSVGETAGEKLKSMGKLGALGTGLTVGTGILDAVDDLSAGKIEGNNTAEKFSNIADITAGGLEAVGTGLDLTGVGAPVGVALNLLGGVVSLAGGIADIVGEEKDKTQAKKQAIEVQAQPVPQQKLQALQTLGTSGAEVRVAQ
jgi:hypothetical protein